MIIDNLLLTNLLTLNPVVFKLSDSKSPTGGQKHVLLPFFYNIVFFPHIQLVTLRGSILEDAVASTGRHGTVRGLPLKEVLEQVVPELNVSCLRLALSTPKVTEQLLKLDEQGVGYESAFAFCFSTYLLN